MGLSKQEYIKQNLISNPKYSGLKVGDTVKWKNDYGVQWENKVIGFNYNSLMAAKYGKTVHLDTDSYWFPHHPNQLKKIKN